MADFLQTLIIAITLGSLYALIALGYTMVYGVLKLINFAHSDVVVLGAWISVTLATFGLPYLGLVDPSAHWWSVIVVLLLSMTICGCIGFAIERLAYKPIRKAPRLNALITAIGVSLFLQNTGQLQFTLIANEKVVASGQMLERGSDPKAVRLASNVKLDPGDTYVVRAIKRDAKPDNDGKLPGKNFRILAPAGEYAPASDIAIEQTIGKVDTRDANFELLRVANHPPLKLPFGAMPAAMPPLMSDRTLVHTVYIEFTKRITEFDSSGKRLNETVDRDVQLVATGTGSPPETLPANSAPDGWVSSESTREDGSRIRTDVTSFLKPVRITTLDLTIVATAALLMTALQFLVFHTRVGTAMRAVSFSMDTSALMGIPVNRIISITFVTGASLAAAAGFLFALKYTQIQQPAHATWTLLGLKAFVAAVVGGIGNIRGATVGGFLIAFIEQFGAYLGQRAHWENASAYTDVFVFALLILVLLIKPTGIFGSTVREKV